MAYTFHDFKKQGLPADRLATWQDRASGEPLLNRKGTTWRKLDAATQASAADAGLSDLTACKEHRQSACGPFKHRARFLTIGSGCIAFSRQDELTDGSGPAGPVRRLNCGRAARIGRRQAPSPRK